MPSDFTFDDRFNLYRDGTGDYATNADESYVRDSIVLAAANAIRTANSAPTPGNKKKLESRIEQFVSDAHGSVGTASARIVSTDASQGTVTIAVSVDGQEFSEQISV